MARPSSPCSMLWLVEQFTTVSDSDRNATVSYVSRLLQQNIHLSEVSLILRLLPSLDFHIKRYAAVGSCTALQKWLICKWLLISLLTAMFCSRKWGLAANAASRSHQTLKQMVKQAWVVLSSGEYGMKTVHGEAHGPVHGQVHGPVHGQVHGPVHGLSIASPDFSKLRKNLMNL